MYQAIEDSVLRFIFPTKALSAILDKPSRYVTAEEHARAISINPDGILH